MQNMKNVYVAFDGDEDMIYYTLMKAWDKNPNINFNFEDSHELTRIMDWSSEESIKANLRERMKNSNIFILLVGNKTKNLFRFVRWEIEQAIKKDLPIIVVNLNNKVDLDNEFCPAIIRDKLALHVSYNPKILNKAIREWGPLHEQKRLNNISSPHRYPIDVYKNLDVY